MIRAMSSDETQPPLPSSTPASSAPTPTPPTPLAAEKLAEAAAGEDEEKQGKRRLLRRQLGLKRRPRGAARRGEIVGPGEEAGDQGEANAKVKKKRKGKGRTGEKGADGRGGERGRDASAAGSHSVGAEMAPSPTSKYARPEVMGRVIGTTGAGAGATDAPGAAGGVGSGEGTGGASGTVAGLAEASSGAAGGAAGREGKEKAILAAATGSAPVAVPVSAIGGKGGEPRVKVIHYGPRGHEEQEVATAMELDAVLTAWKASRKNVWNGMTGAGAGGGGGMGSAAAMSGARSAGGPAPMAAPVGGIWVDVWGLENPEIISTLGRHFGLHKLELEDIVNTHQRSKTETYGDHVYIVVREAFIDPRDGGLDTDQISVALGTDWLLTFQEKHGDCFDPVRERIRHRKGKLHASGPDALMYALLDAVIDSYFPVLEYYGERLETIELESTDKPSLKVAHEIHDVKRDLLFMRRAIWPAREAVNTLIRDDSLSGWSEEADESEDGAGESGRGMVRPALIRDETRIYLRDCYDHLVQLIDMLENYREIASGLMDIYHSSMSNRMNEIMKVLTIISTIFMPLGFIAGVYGMNFRTARDGGSPNNMPELDWWFGYPMILGLMGITATIMLIYFWRKGWLGRG